MNKFDSNSKVSKVKVMSKKQPASCTKALMSQVSSTSERQNHDKGLVCSEDLRRQECFTQQNNSAVKVSKHIQ